MATTRLLMGPMAILAVLLAQLQPVLAAAFWTITEYRVISETYETSTRYIYTSTYTYTYTYTSTLTLDPTVTPTAKPTSSRTTTNYYGDVVTVAMYLPASEVPSSQLVTDLDTGSSFYTQYVVPVTYTAPASCPTPFTVATYTNVYIPYDVRPRLSGVSTTTAVTTYTYLSTSRYTDVTVFVDQTAVPTTQLNPTSNFAYTYYVQNCRNPTASSRANGPSSGGDSDRGWDWDDYEVCALATGCVRVKTYIIVIAVLIPSIFLLGFLESYLWFRRMMLGRSALRLGTVCWCFISLWGICLIRKSPNRSPEDQVLLKQYWATLGGGTRIKLWFKWGFRWQYPVELIGNPGPDAVVVVSPPPQPPNPGQPGYMNPDGTPGDGPEKTAAQTAVYAPVYPQQQPQQQPQQAYMMPQNPGYYNPSAPPPPQHGYGMMPAPPQNVYMGQQQPQQLQQQQAGFAPTPPPPGGDGSQQQGQGGVYPPYVPTPSPPVDGLQQGGQGQGQQGQQPPR